MGGYRYPVEELLQLVNELGEKALQAHSAGIATRRKPDRTVVTEMDVYIEDRLFEFVRTHFPDDGFAGEEGRAVTSRSGRVWLVDPIDGTQQYVRGQDFWGILVACVADDVPDLGVIAHPARRDLVWAERGKGCHSRTQAGEEQLRTSLVDRIEDAYVLHNGIDFACRTGKLDQLRRIVRTAEAERGYADSFGHTEVIRGRADVMIDFLAEPHDIAAVAVCVAEAGGSWSGLTRQDSVHQPGPVSVTANGHLGSLVSAELAGTVQS
ncbi:inositol monophosphatase family protein [Micromonospora sp. CPCC 205558]|uniref:inositol monophosphatase family protein n=1 Tax=Micromonospora sp. CPCC 205558 TaxID=3122403 RepID=UPI002FEEE26F